MKSFTSANLSQFLPTEQVRKGQILVLIRLHNQVIISIAVPHRTRFSISEDINLKTAATVRRPIIKHNLANSCFVFLRSHVRMTSLKTG